MRLAHYLIVLVTLVPSVAEAQGSPDQPVVELTKAPELLEFVSAPYPETEMDDPRKAEVLLTILISAEGQVAEARIAESAGTAFDEAALNAVTQFKFSPAEVDGQPTAVKITYRYVFEAPVPMVTLGDFGGVLLDEETKTPISGARIRIVGQGETTTDTEGRFAFTGLKEGTIQVEVMVEGLDAPLSVQEEVLAGERIEASYQVVVPRKEPEEEAGDDLEVVVVAPPQLTRKVSSTEIAADEARQLPGTQGDVLKVVQSMPGVGRASAGSGALIVWGAAPADTRTYIGAVRVPSLYHFGGLRSVLNGDLVAGIELTPGGYGAAHGRGLGGLVLVTPKAPANDRLHGSVQADILDASVVVTAPVGNESNSFIASARKSYVANLASLVVDDSAGQYFTVPNYYDGALRFRHTIADGVWFEVGGMISGDVQDRTSPSNDPTLRSKERRSLDFQRVDLRYHGKSSNGSESDVSLWYGHDLAGRSLESSGIEQSEKGESHLVGLRIDHTQVVLPSLDARVGLDFELVYSENDRSGALTSPPREGDPYVFGRPPADELLYDDWTSVSLSAAPYVEFDYSPFGEVLHVVPGLRLEPYLQTVQRLRPNQENSPDIATLTEDVLVEPRLMVEYTPWHPLSLKTSGGLYRQPAEPGELSTTFGNPLLNVARGAHLLGGISYRVTQSLTLEGTGFYTRAWDTVSRNPSNTPLVAQTLVQEGNAKTFGGQFMLRKEKGVDPLYGWISYTIMRSERRDAGQSEYRLSDTDQTHALTGIASYQVGSGIEFGLRARYATGFPRVSVTGAYYDTSTGRYEPLLGESNSTRIPAFFQLDARVSKVFTFPTSSLEIYLDVQNVTNRSNPEEIAYSPDYQQQRYVMGLPILPVLGARLEY